MMKVLYWNARGVANQSTLSFLSLLCSINKPDLLFIAEPWASISSISPLYWKNLRLKFFAANNRGSLKPNLWAFCEESLNPMVLSSSFQHVSISVYADGIDLFFSAIYACTTYVLRRQLWVELANLQQNNVGLWCFLGDFNAVMGAHEKRGGRLPLPISYSEFRS